MTKTMEKPNPSPKTNQWRYCSLSLKLNMTKIEPSQQEVTVEPEKKYISYLLRTLVITFIQI